mmetsp:Transcript_10360/g.26839  ORF Transcript_10360/g.26839 Transcript_10360/m.26839 type:complete len:281 (-) Transcript_10360:11-853(-)
MHMQPKLLLDGLQARPRCCLQQSPQLIRAPTQGTFCVPAVVHHSSGPSRPSACELVAQEDGGARQVRRGIADRLDLQKSELHQVLCQALLHGVAAVRALQAVREVHRRGDDDLEVYRDEDPALHLDDIVRGEGVVRDMRELSDLRHIDFLELGCNEHARHTDQLKLLAHDHSAGEVAVGKVLSQEQGLGLELEVAEVHLHKPIQQDPAHHSVDVPLRAHVVSPESQSPLLLEQLCVDLFCVLCHLLDVVRVVPERCVEGGHVFDGPGGSRSILGRRGLRI